MLLELAALNASFAVLKAGFNNGRDLVEMGTTLSKWFEASSEINQKQSNKEGSGTALECWQQQELVKRQREHLRWAIGKTRLQAWSDFIKFEAEWHREKKEAAHAERVRIAKKQKAMVENINLGIQVMGCLLLAMGLLFGITFYYMR